MQIGTLREAYGSFQADNSPEVVITQTADGFSTSSLPLSQMPLMTDYLHPKTRARSKRVRPLAPDIIYGLA